MFLANAVQVFIQIGARQLVQEIIAVSMTNLIISTKMYLLSGFKGYFVASHVICIGFIVTVMLSSFFKHAGDH